MIRKKFKRVVVIVVDSWGFGSAPDAAEYGDEGSDTMGHIDASVESLHLPWLQKLGAFNLKHIQHIPPLDHFDGYCLTMREHSNSKDTMTGHWEIMGLYIK